MSVAMLRESVRQGVDGIVFTPHFYADQDSPERFLRRRAEAVERLRPMLDQVPDCPQMLLGAEVHYYAGMGRSTALEQFCIGQSNVVLVEMPFHAWSSSMVQDIESIRTRLGLQVLIAHINRYLNQPDDYLTALRTDCKALIQANAEFFLDRWTRRKAVRMLERREIDLLGSDCHNMAERAPNLGPAVEYIEGKLGPTILDRIDRRGRPIFRAAMGAQQSC